MFILENFNVASFALGLLVGVGFEYSDEYEGKEPKEMEVNNE